MPDESPPRSNWRFAKRIVVAIVGTTVLLAGVAMLVLPGPGIVVMLLGLGILGLEFPFALRWMRALKARGQSTLAWWRKRR